MLYSTFSRAKVARGGCLPVLYQMGTTWRGSHLRYSSDHEWLPDWVGFSLIIFVPKCMKKLGDKVDEEEEEELSIQCFAIGL